MDLRDCWVFIVIIFAGIVAFIVRAARVRERRARWVRVAAELGWQFSPDDPFGTAGALAQPLFQQGHSRRVSNVMWGSYRDVPVRCFDYRYTVGSGKNAHTYYFTCVLLASPVLFAPMVIRPEGIGDKIGHLLGLHDVQFESDEFNRRYAVRCQDAKLAFDVVHARTMEFLLAVSGMVIEATGSSIVIHRGQGQASATLLGQQIRRLLDFGIGFVGLLPEYLQRIDVKGVELPHSRPTEGLEWTIR